MSAFMKTKSHLRTRSERLVSAHGTGAEPGAIFLLRLQRMSQKSRAAPTHTSTSETNLLANVGATPCHLPVRAATWIGAFGLDGRNRPAV